MKGHFALERFIFRKRLYISDLDLKFDLPLQSRLPTNQLFHFQTSPQRLGANGKLWKYKPTNRNDELTRFYCDCRSMTDADDDAQPNTRSENEVEKITTSTLSISQKEAR